MNLSLRDSSYILDFLSIFPTDFAYFLFSSSCYEQIPCPVIVRLNRILRIYRMMDFFNKTETRTSSPNAFRISKIIFYLLILIHWDACLYFVVRKGFIYFIQLLELSNLQCISGNSLCYW